MVGNVVPAWQDGGYGTGQVLERDRRPRAGGGGRVSRRLREIAAPFVAAVPAGARVRTRLRVCAQDEVVLRAVGMHLGSLAGRDLAARCAEGRLGAKGRAESRRERKRALTAESSSRWAGAITRTSEDAWQLASRNLTAERASLTARVRKVEARLAVQAGDKQGRTRGYATAAERHSKAVRLKALKARLAHVERRLDAGAVAVTRGGKNLLRKRNNLAGAGLTEARWRQEWEASRLFLTADGEAAKRWGNETIPLELAGLSAATRDGRLRAAVTRLIAAAKAAGARAVVIEDLDFAEARGEGRERTGSRPSRGRRGRGYRRMVAGIPTAKLRDRLTQMASNAGLSVVVVDPAYTSRWSAVHWLPLLREQHPETTGHHAAALVMGRRGLGHRARTRVNGNRTAPADAMRPARTRPRKPPAARPQPGNPPPHVANGSHQATRPDRPTGPRQATRRPRTVRDRPPRNTQLLRSD